MKDMLASLPQYQEQREKVGLRLLSAGALTLILDHSSPCI
jgi:hypothetical protein